MRYVNAYASFPMKKTPLSRGFSLKLFDGLINLGCIRRGRGGDVQGL